MASIDVKEILRNSMQPPDAKRRRPNLNTATASTAEILAALEKEDESQEAIIDEVTVKRLSQQLQKRCDKNREQRIKHGDDPQKFMESEVDLNNAIQEMHVIAAQPNLYPVFIECGVITLLIQLLSHENTDIVAIVCNLLQELTDVEILHEGGEDADLLIDELLKCQIIETIVQQGISRFNEDIQDEADAVNNALSTIENILDFRPEAAKQCTQGLFPWLLTRATKKTVFDANKLFASQLLHMLLQSHDDVRKKLTEKTDGIDLLLRALASYKRHDPSSPDEYEHMENLFDALCASLMYLPNRQIFLDGEGLQLMNLILREKKKQSREGALKVLSHATAIPDGSSNCDKFIEILGLRTLFPLFMRTPSKVQRKDTNPDEHEEHVCSIIDALLFLCNEVNRQRVATKFEEHGCEKVDRALELYVKYTGRVQKFSAKIAKNEMLSSLDSDELYIEKLGNGLYTLQRVALIISEVCVNGPVACRERAMKMLRMKLKNSSLSDHLEPILREFHENLGDDADVQKQRVENLIIRLSDISNVEQS